jgi:hypothetical protein
VITEGLRVQLVAPFIDAEVLHDMTLTGRDGRDLF